MKRDQENLFCMWKLFSNDELRESTLAGAKIELASRTKDANDVQQAVLALDSNTFNAIFVLTLFEDDKLQKLLFEKDVYFVTTLVSGRTLCVEENAQLFLYLKDRLYGKTKGVLGKLADSLDVLTKRFIRGNSAVFTNLYELGFTKLEAKYLNYEWLKDKVSDVRRANEFVTLMDCYFALRVELSTQQKKFIQRELQVKFYYPVNGAKTIGEYVSKFCERVAVLDENWEFARSLVSDKLLLKDNKISSAIPFLSSDEKRFISLDREEKFYSIDNCLPAIKSKESLLLLLDKYDFREYLEEFDRDFYVETIDAMIRLGIRDYDNFTDEELKKILKAGASKSLLFYLMKNSRINILNQLGFYTYSVNESNLFRYDFSTEEQKSFISYIIQVMYDKESDSGFINFVIQLLKTKQLVKFYDRELLLDIVRLLIKDFSNSFYDYGESLLELYAPSEEYEKYCNDVAEAERIRKEELKKRAFDNFCRKTRETMQNIETVSELEECVDNYWSHDNNYDEFFWNCIKEKLQDLIDKERTFNEAYFFINYELLKHSIINSEECLDNTRKLMTLIEMEA